MWSDKETKIDYLNIYPYVETITTLVQDPSLLPLTIGIFGDWGNGKSSVLKMVRKELKGKDGVVCVPFNGWLFEDYDDAKSALMGAILDKIEKERSFIPEIGNKISKLRKRVDWLGLLTKTGGYGLQFLLGNPLGAITSLTGNVIKEGLKNINSDRLEEVTKLIRDTQPTSSEVRKTIREFKSEFKKLLKETKIKQLVVIIDDLDRCLPDTIIETLEAVKLFLSTDKTVTLISIDERLIKYAVDNRYTKFDDDIRKQITKDYIEKLIQIPIRLPLMNRNEMKSYINLMFASRHIEKGIFKEILNKVKETRKGENFNFPIDHTWFEEHGVAIDTEFADELIITDLINDLVYESLKGNPRQVKRFMNTLVIRMHLAKLRGVTPRKQVLAKLMTLEYVNVDHFKKLGEWQAVQDGKPKEIAELEKLAKGEISSINNSEFNKWVRSKWVRNWLVTGPSLGDENLGIYFYISRDEFSYLPSSLTGLTEVEAQILDYLASGTKAGQVDGIKKFKELEYEQTKKILKAFKDNLSKTDFKSKEDKLKIETWILLGMTKLEHLSEVLEELFHIDDTVYPLTVVLHLKKCLSLGSEDEKSLSTQLLDKLTKSKNQQLAKAAMATK